MVEIKGMQKDIIEYDLRDLADGIEINEWRLFVINDSHSDSIIIQIQKDDGEAVSHIPRSLFLKMDDNDFDALINTIIYYNYQEYELD